MNPRDRSDPHRLERAVVAGTNHLDYIPWQGTQRPPPRVKEQSGKPELHGSVRVEQPRYRAFLSYSHRDGQWADWLHKALESYRPPKQLVGTTTGRGAVPKRLAPVFRDREELASAIDLGAVINEALRASACQIVICSPHAAKSRWVNEEI